MNVLLDALLQRSPWHTDANAILIATALGQVNCAATTLSLATLFYVGRKAVGTPAVCDGVRRHLAALDILPIDRQMLLNADAMPGSDFEDNIVIAAAIVAPVDAIVTRNAGHFRHCPIPVWEPAELLSRLPAGGSSAESGQ